MMRTVLALALCALAACTTPELRVAPAAPETAPDATPSARQAIPFASVEMALVTMPIYAATEEIFAQQADGTLALSGLLWADEPPRAVTLDLVRHVREITGALVAPDPWPFRTFAQVRLDVRVRAFYPTATGTFLLSGQYFVAPEESGPDRARSFRLEQPIAGDGAAALAEARARAVRALAEDIVERGLR